MLQNNHKRCVILLYGSSASLTRKLQASQKLMATSEQNEVDQPMDILHLDLTTAIKKFPNQPKLIACRDDPDNLSYTIITASYLPLRMLGNEEDGMFPFGMHNFKLV
jgi:hypothetical protein